VVRRLDAHHSRSGHDVKKNVSIDTLNVGPSFLHKDNFLCIIRLCWRHHLLNIIRYFVYIDYGGGEIFRTRPDRPWGPPSLLYNGYRVFPGGKAAGAWC
jgi:hypothetical protein